MIRDFMLRIRKKWKHSHKYMKEKFIMIAIKAASASKQGIPYGFNAVQTNA